ncbi:hypothetical protein ES707_04064 [subsurface metagenome]
MPDITLHEGTNELNVGMTPIAPPVASLYGLVTDAETGYALEGVKVTIDGLVTYTNSLGQYAFEGLTPGSYSIEFSKDGYETLVR